MALNLVLLIVGVAAVGILTYFIARQSPILKNVLSVIYVIGILVLLYFLWESIMRPIRFEKQKDVRYTATINRLKDVRTAQLAYKSEYGKFTGDFDSLINFVSTGQLKLVKAIGMVPDSIALKHSKMIDAEREALELGIISRDTLQMSVRDSLFGPKYPLDSLKYVPFSNGTKFELGATILKTASQVEVPVFEAKAHNNVILKGLNKQLIINLNDQRKKNELYPGLKVGALTETTNNAGNWE